VEESNVFPHFTHFHVTFLGTEVPPQTRYRMPSAPYSRSQMENLLSRSVPHLQVGS